MSSQSWGSVDAGAQCKRNLKRVLIVTEFVVSVTWSNQNSVTQRSGIVSLIPNRDEKILTWFF